MANYLEITLAKPVTARDLKSIHVELRPIHKMEGFYEWQLFCKDTRGRERGRIYAYETYAEAVKAATNLHHQLAY